jgi:hypothetical protein
MTTQKTFKRRIRARMSKTGEAYTTARTQLVRKAGARPAGGDANGATRAADTQTPSQAELPVSDEALRERSGHGWDHWFRVLDAWGATNRGHTEIAKWLREEQGVGGWWAQSITGGYERARGMRAKHQFAQGFAVSANRTIHVPLDRAMDAFSQTAIRRRWMPDTPIQRRRTKAANALVFDWAEPPSRVTAWFVARGDAKSTVTVEHSRLPNARTAERFKSVWRERLVELKTLLEKG